MPARLTRRRLLLAALAAPFAAIARRFVTALTAEVFAMPPLPRPFPEVHHRGGFLIPRELQARLERDLAARDFTEMAGAIRLRGISGAVSWDAGPWMLEDYVNPGIGTE